MYLVDHSTAVLTSCIITGNAAQEVRGRCLQSLGGAFRLGALQGGAMYLSSSSKATLNFCTLSDNQVMTSPKVHNFTFVCRMLKHLCHFAVITE